MTRDRTAASWIPIVSKAAGPVYLAIADALAADIRSGRLPAGTRLPPQRALAEALGLDFTTVSRAYAEAQRRGLVEGRVGQGTYVRAPRPEVSEPAGGVVDLAMNLPPRFADPALVQRMWQGVRGLEATGLDLLLRYQEPGGSGRDRAAGAQWLAPRLPHLSPERVLVCAGAQGALLAVLGTLAAPGDLVAAPALTYPGLLALAAQLRLQLVPMPVDDQGVRPDAFEAVCRDRRPKLLYCNPTLHNPTTATLPPARRVALVEIARDHGVAIVEDDAYGALPSDPPPPLAALAPDLVYHVAGVAKTLSPALRIAYLAVPDRRAALRLAGAVRATAHMASPLGAAIATRWIEDGTADAVQAAIRAEARARQAIAARILPADSVQADPEGFHAWLRLPAPWTAAAFAARLGAAGLGVVPADAFAIGAAPEAVRLGLGAPATRDDLRQALHVVTDLAQQPPAASTVVV